MIFILFTIQKQYFSNFADVVPLEGHFPFIEEIRNFLVIGPITRYAEDLTLMLKVMSGPNADQLQLDTKVHSILIFIFINLF